MPKSNARNFSVSNATVAYNSYCVPEVINESLPRLQRGNLRNRVLLYLTLNHRLTSSVEAIALGTNTTTSRAKNVISELVAEGKVRAIRSNTSQVTYLIDKLNN